MEAELIAEETPAAPLFSVQGQVDDPNGRTAPLVCIIDDEPNIRALLEESLEDLVDEGVELAFADNGEDGLNLILARKPQLVFLDVMMPKMNGFDVCAKVKGEYKLKEVHVVMLTAKGQEFDRQKGLAVGADVYMTMPFSPKKIKAAAAAVLGL